jgi:hypothetical protein
MELKIIRGEEILLLQQIHYRINQMIAADCDGSPDFSITILLKQYLFLR